MPLLRTDILKLPAFLQKFPVPSRQFGSAV
jgi:hypothetical protein